MSDLTRKQREIMYRLQDEGDYTIIYGLSDECWFIPRILIGNLLTCKIIDIETLIIKGLVTVEYNKYDSSVGVISLTEKGKERKYESWWEMCEEMVCVRRKE